MIYSALRIKPGTLHFVPGHFVPGHFVPGHFVPALCLLFTLSPGSFVPWSICPLYSNFDLRKFTFL
jgi:hypothetical protein